MRWLYNLSLHLALPLMLLRLWWRGRREPGYRVHWAQRFGQGPAQVKIGGVHVQADADQGAGASQDRPIENVQWRQPSELDRESTPKASSVVSIS